MDEGINCTDKRTVPDCFCCSCARKTALLSNQDDGAEIGSSNGVDASLGNPIDLNIIHVDRRNEQAAFQQLRELFSSGTADFMSIDVEFSGLPEALRGRSSNIASKDHSKKKQKKKNAEPNIPNPLMTDSTLMYASLREDVIRYGVMSLGLAVFCKKNSASHGARQVEPVTEHHENQDINEHEIVDYEVSVFEFVFKKEPDLLLTSDSAAFLIQHGFDLHHMFLNGIPYKVSEAVDHRDTAALQSPEEVQDQTQDNSDNHGEMIEDVSILELAASKLRIPLEEATALVGAEKMDLGEDEDGQPFGAVDNRVVRRKRKKQMKKEKKKQTQILSGIQWEPLPRAIMFRTRLAKIPIVVHNGLLDLMFTLHSFEVGLPPTLNSFVTQLAQRVFAVYDTKTIGHGDSARYPTYLSYMYTRQRRLEAKYPKFRIVTKSLVSNPAAKDANGEHDRHGQLESDSSSDSEGKRQKLSLLPFQQTKRPEHSHVTALNTKDDVLEGQIVRSTGIKKIYSIPESCKCKYSDSKELATESATELATGSGVCTSQLICESFASRGYCIHDALCPFGHCMHAVLRRDEIVPVATLDSDNVKKRLEILRMQARSKPLERALSTAPEAEEKPHSASYDAFCTGFIFASLRARKPELVEAAKNRIKIAPQAVPALIEESAFTS